MNIDTDCVVRFHYRLRDSDGRELESSFDGEPVAYLHGHDGIIRGLEAEMAGKCAGDTFTATVPPELGYGAREAGATARIPMKHVLTRGKLKPGQVVAVNTEHGPREVVVIKPGRFVVDVDTNHPLAGQTLQFEVEILDVRAASDEERAHGHVHGAGGHHHD